MGGGKGGSFEVEQNPIQNFAILKQLGMQEDYMKETAPFRQGFASDYATLRGENYDPTNLPGYKQAFGLQKRSLESQYQLAKDQIMGSVPSGGSLAGALSNLEMNRASTMGALPAATALPIISDYQNKAYGAGYQAPQVTLGSNANLVNALTSQQNSMINAASNQYMANQQASNSILGGIGKGLGYAVGK